MVNFKYFRPLWSVFSKFWVGPGPDQTGFYKYCEIMLYSYVPNFNFSWRSRLGGGSAQTYEECSNLSIFCRFDHFPHVFGQFKAWIELNFADFVNFVSLILCPNVFCR